MVTEILERAGKKKQKAMALRNFGDFETAIQILESLIAELDQSLKSGDLSGPDKIAVRDEMADAYGIMGGTYRRWHPEDLSLALQQYRVGARYEDGDSKSTYNTSNMITLGITKGEPPDDPELKKALDNVIERLEKDTKGSRADEWWAWSDLAQFYVLRNEIDRAQAAYERAMGTGPTAAERRRHVEVLRELSKALPTDYNALAANIDNVANKLDPDPPR